MNESLFESLAATTSLTKKDFKQHELAFRAELLSLQRALAKQQQAVLIIVAGVEGSGKGDVVDRLNKWFDSRGMQTHAFWDETDEETQRPAYWRYWRRLPARGTMAVMFGGWYWPALYGYAKGDIGEQAFNDKLQRIHHVESMLTADGMLIIKLWFHLSEDAFQRRNKKRSPANQHIQSTLFADDAKKHYQHFIQSADKLLTATNNANAAWSMINADNEYQRDVEVANILLEKLRAHLQQVAQDDQHDAIVMQTDEQTLTKPLDQLCLTQSMPREQYKQRLKQRQRQLAELAWQAYDKKRSTVIVFEGWDAAGKGGAIRRITRAIDARLYRELSIAAPSDEELAQHYLWRFWRQIPRAGYISLYDRSWYGRVLVERVEGLARHNEWQRAYEEINDFERQLVESGTRVIKFWLHISPEEQLKRFQERKKTPWKQHKLTDEDWRNREKWPAYTDAINDMIQRTNTPQAPWHLIPANDKYHARVEVLKSVCEVLS